MEQLSDQEWSRRQIESYSQVYSRYMKTAEVVDTILEIAAKQMAPKAIIQTRPKSIPSFAEKALRKKKKGRYDDPLRRMTDLCGARVIIQTLAEVHAVCEFIEGHFIIDAENSVDVSERLKPSEFGYRSVHYVVQFKRGVFPTGQIAINIPDELFPENTHPMKIEIQVRTMLEHSWANFVHDRVYKSAYTIPPKWERELAVLAGMLEQTDQSFTRIQSGLQAYSASYGAYMNEEQLREEIGILESVLICDPENPDLAHRIGKLAMEMGDWPKAIDIFSKYVASGYQPILRDLGVVLCKVNGTNPQSKAYKDGQKYLEAASAPPYRDADALASLAGTWKKIDETKTREYYRKAFEIDPTDPYAVSNYLVYEIIHQRNLTPASLMSPSIKQAIQRCLDQAEVGMNTPWTYYNLGMFHLLLGQPYASLAAYMQAIQLSPTDWMVETSLHLLEKLNPVQSMIQGYAWALKLLTLGRVVKFNKQDIKNQLIDHSAEKTTPVVQPVVIVAGGTSNHSKIDQYQQILLEGFKNFNGTLISGGTTSGISGLVGKIQVQNPSTIYTIGYVPTTLPRNVQIDANYRQIRTTEGESFSALEPLQYWTDIIASGIPADQVKLIGINGGEISSFEYRLALMLGASVAVIDNSGREASLISKDPYWGNSKRLIHLSTENNEIEKYIHMGSA